MPYRNGTSYNLPFSDMGGWDNATYRQTVVPPSSANENRIRELQTRLHRESEQRTVLLNRISELETDTNIYSQQLREQRLILEEVDVMLEYMPGVGRKYFEAKEDFEYHQALQHQEKKT